MKTSGYKPLATGLLAIFVLTGTYFLGYTVGHNNLEFEKGLKPTVVNKELKKPREVDFSLYWEVWDRVKRQYAGEIDAQKMVYGAIHGALASLEDPYTLFLEPQEAKRFDEDLKGSFDGIGAEIEKRDNNITIVAPLDDSPAEKAGLKGKDIIVKIDDQETKDLSLQEAIDKIRGNKGTTVKLTVFREGQADFLQIPVTRDTIQVKSVKWEIKEGNIGYIKLGLFGEDTLELMNQAIDEMLLKQPKGVIVDVRNDPGGLLDGAVDITSLFLKDRGVVVKERDRDGRVTELKTTLNARLTDVPLVVLVNGGSASASEIFAGALQDYGRAKLIGEKTFGKGSVQLLDKLRSGEAVRITVAKWLTPKDRQIDKQGIAPDIEIKLTEDDVKNNRDPQLERAMQELNK